MNLLENIRESIRAIKSNLLRTILTGLIISIGIMSLVGILTAVDGIKHSLDQTFSSLGANSFFCQSALCLQYAMPRGLRPRLNTGFLMPGIVSYISSW